MKESLKFLNRISKIKGLEPENYYVIKIHPEFIYLQGDFKADLSKRLKELIHNSLIDTNGYIIFQRNKLEIILT